MQINFKNKYLEKCYLKHDKAVKEFGEQVARKYIQRIGIIKQTKNLDELKKLPGLDCHPLTGNRQGQFAVKLTEFNRLIFTLEGDHFHIVCIEEVSKHYED